jgi:hypothetical protein
LWLSIGLDLWSLAAEASAVVCHRAIKISAGDEASFAEAHQMVGEKVEAVMTIQAKVMSGELGATPFGMASQIVTHLRRRVRANRRRLTRGRTSN